MPRSDSTTPRIHYKHYKYGIFRRFSDCVLESSREIIIYCTRLLRLLRSNGVEQELSSLGVLTPVGDDNTRSTNNLSGVTLSVELAQTSPLTELLGIGDLDKGDLLLGLVAESLDELEVRLVGDGVTEHTELGLSSRQSLGALSQTSDETVVDDGLLQDGLEGILKGESSGGGSGGNLDFSDNFRIRLGLVVDVVWACGGVDTHHFQMDFLTIGNCSVFEEY